MRGWIFCREKLEDHPSIKNNLEMKMIEEDVRILKKKTIATLFAGLENVHLVKDPGMIPFALHKYYDYNAIVPLSSLQDYPYKDRYFRDIETPVIEDKSEIRDKYIRRLKWLVKNARRIDLMNVFFFDRWTWIYIYIYRLLNKKGKIYVHVDTDGKRLLDYKFTNNKLKYFLLRRFLLSDENMNKTLWGIQNEENARKIKGKWPFYNVEYIPDGIYWEQDNLLNYSEKENTIITVARNGTPQKRTDLLLNGFACVADKFPTWKLKLIGTIEEDFKPFIHKFFIDNPELKKRVEFVGPIYDRNALAEEYSRAKVFCLTSSWESFGLVTAEAMSRGCYVIGSNIPATAEIVNYGEYGTLFENGNLDDFIVKLGNVLRDEEHIKKVVEKSTKYANAKYKWKNNVKPIDDWMRSEV